jgi:glyoxylase I family protein
MIRRPLGRDEEGTVPVAIATSGVHHIALRSTNLERSRRFYVDTLGFPLALEGPNIFLCLAGTTAVAVRGPEASTSGSDVFDPFRVGLDHVALACADENELVRVAAALERAGVDNTGVRIDPALERRYVAFKDPDRIAWELYMAPDLAVQAAQAYMDGLDRKNVDQVPFAEDVVFQGPLGPTLTGAGAVRDFLRSVFPLLTGVRVLQHVSHGDYVGTRFELGTVHGVIPAFDWLHVVHGEIVEARPFYDPRPITDAAAREA